MTRPCSQKDKEEYSLRKNNEMSPDLLIHVPISMEPQADPKVALSAGLGVGSWECLERVVAEGAEEGVGVDLSI